MKKERGRKREREKGRKRKKEREKMEGNDDNKWKCFPSFALSINCLLVRCGFFLLLLILPPSSSSVYFPTRSSRASGAEDRSLSLNRRYFLSLLTIKEKRENSFHFFLTFFLPVFLCSFSHLLFLSFTLFHFFSSFFHSFSNFFSSFFHSLSFILFLSFTLFLSFFLFLLSLFL